MADTSETRTFEEIVSTTLDDYRDTLVDNIFKSNPAFFELKRKGCYKAAGGGVQIVVPLLYGKNTTVAGYSGYETIDLSPQEGITSALYPWAQVAGSVIIDGLSEWKNSGKHQVINLLGAKISQLESSMQEQFSAWLFEAGKYSASQTSKNPMGIAAICPEVPGSYDIGGIDGATETWWKNKVKGNAGTTWTWIQYDSLSTEVTGPAAMRVLYNNCSKGSGGSPDLILASQKLFENYEAYLSPFKRFMDDEAAQAGFTNLKYRGATLYWDEQFQTLTNITSGASTAGAYFLNSKTIALMYSPSHNFTRTPFVRPINQDARASMVLWYGNMTCNCRRKNGVMVDASLTDVT